MPKRVVDTLGGMAHAVKSRTSFSHGHGSDLPALHAAPYGRSCTSCLVQVLLTSDAETLVLAL